MRRRLGYGWLTAAALTMSAVPAHSAAGTPGTTTPGSTARAGLDIDHVSRWPKRGTAGRRRGRGSGASPTPTTLGDDRHLEAVSLRSNRQKGDQDVTEWLPEESVRCKYLTYWVPVKLSWSLSVDESELQPLHSFADGCPGTDITYTPVPEPLQRRPPRQITVSAAADGGRWRGRGRGGH
ncbi:hypothetical protein ACIRD9_07850 [Streptomyces violaceus]|uniref:hypothetical protein n=1 Tax=Streptomyces violaceus TaxID=1936 RepID=UPI0037F7DC96